MPIVTNPPTIWSTAAVQHGLITRPQLTALGLSRDQRRALLDSGRLERIGRRTLRVPGSPRSTLQLVLAGCLDTGGVASHRTAAWLQDPSSFPPPSTRHVPEVLLTRASFDYASPLARVHTTAWLPSNDLLVIEGIPTTSVARTFLSLAALVPDELSRRRLAKLVDASIRDGRASDKWLWWLLERTRRSGRNGVSTLEDILGERAGGNVTHSWLERETYAVLERANLPLPECQRRIRRRGAFVARVDFLYPDVKVVIEVSGYRWHKSLEAQIRDAERRRLLTLEGYDVLEYTYYDVVARPGLLVAEIAERLGRRAAA